MLSLFWYFYHMYGSVMVIDDSALERFIGEAMIKNIQFAKTVISYADASEALAFLLSLENEPGLVPQVIFVDIQMPVMTGFAFLDEYMKLPEVIRQLSRVVMLSSSLAESDQVQIGMYPVVIKFLTKPLTEAALRNLSEPE